MYAYFKRKAETQSACSRVIDLRMSFSVFAGTLNLMVLEDTSWMFLVEKNPWIRIVLQKLIAAQLVNKYSVFYGTRKFSIMLKNLRSAGIKPMVSHPVSLKFNLIFPSHLFPGLPTGSFLPDFSTKRL